MTIWLATTNIHKIKEIKSLFKDHISVSFKSISTYPNYTIPKETGQSFAENAKIKSLQLLHFLKQQSISLNKNIWILGEDSGLEVEALNQAPGIFSARYGGLHATDHQNNQLLLKNLKNKQSRKARYVCVLSCLCTHKQDLLLTGICKGSIAFQEKGRNGFGYDSLFIPEGETRTLGQCAPHIKEQISHRSQALNQFKKYLGL